MIGKGVCFNRLCVVTLVQIDDHLFDQGPNIRRIDKAHFQVELGKFRLTVGAQVFIAKAAGNLKIAFNASHHEQLLKLLRALRQRIEFPGMKTAGHNKIARTLWRALEQNRRLNLQKVAFRKDIRE